jgi:hypothetical protein
MLRLIGRLVAWLFRPRTPKGMGRRYLDERIINRRRD